MGRCMRYKHSVHCNLGNTICFDVLIEPIAFNAVRFDREIRRKLNNNHGNAHNVPKSSKLE